MANNLVKAITTRDVRELIGQPALTNNYLVTIPVLSSEVGNNQNLGKHIENYGRLTDGDFLKRKLGLLCSDASLPTSSYATAEVKDNFVGVTQEFAHTRLYADTDFTFYVDKNYDSLKFFEAWMDYISGAGGVSQNDEFKRPGYFRRMAYPEYYKVSEMSITKFERNISGEHLKYTFINAFPKSMTAIPVAYGAADLLKVTVSFNYDRYIIERKKSIDQKNSRGGNNASIDLQGRDFDDPMAFTGPVRKSASELEEERIRDRYFY